MKFKLYEIRSIYDPKKIFFEMRDDYKDDILRSQDLNTVYGLNVKIIPYPENFFVAWVILSSLSRL